MRRKNLLNAKERENARPQIVETGQRTIVDCLRLFLNDSKLRNVRPATIRYYEREITYFHRDVEVTFVEEVTFDVIKEGIKTMQNHNLKTSTINSRLRAIRAFYNHLFDYKVIKYNPVEHLKLLRDREPIIETYSVKQIRQLLATCDLTTFVGLRDYTIIYLLFDTGIRLSEVAGIEIDDIQFAEGVIRIRRTKNNFERFVPLQKTLSRQLKNYLKVRGITESNALFVTLDGTPLTNRQYQNRFSYYGNLAKITNVRNSPHTMRHTFAKNYIQNGGGTFDLMRIMGHTSMEMTKRYVRLFGTELNEKHRESSPLENLYKGDNKK